MKEEINDLVKRLEKQINKTPTGDLRNLLCDANILIQSLNNANIVDLSDLNPSFVNTINRIIESERKNQKSKKNIPIRNGEFKPLEIM